MRSSRKCRRNRSAKVVLVEQAAEEGQPSGLYRLPLRGCGPYVAARLHAFEQALIECRSKSPAKRAEMKIRAMWAGGQLSDAVQEMKRRLETEIKERQLFYVDDNILPPFHFGNRLDVRVYYRFRRTIDDDWTHSSITFCHTVQARTDYGLPLTKRKPNASKQKADLQEKLYRSWEYLMRGALYSVRDYFKDGGDGALIPVTFQAKVDAHTRDLNNFSTQFWRERSEPS